MSISIKELQALLEAKGGTTQNSSSLQDLKALLNNLGSLRSATLPADTGQNRTGVSCTGHDGNKFPYSSGLSLKQLSDHSANLKSLTCTGNTTTLAYCTARDAATVCECNSRSDQVCSARTPVADYPGCTCVSRTAIAPCSCNTQITCKSRTYSCPTRVPERRPPGGCTDLCDGCFCDGEVTVPACACNSEAVCAARTATYDNVGCTCASRYSTPICSCDSRADVSCSCNSRTQCACNARCGCNTETLYS